jgi:hypothetical protein
MMEIVIKKGVNGGSDRKQTVPFIFWKLSIDQEARHLERVASEDSDDAFINATLCMSHMQI